MKKLIILGLVAGVFATQALAGNIALRAGFVPAGYGDGKFTYASGSAPTTVQNNAGGDLAAGCAAECYWMGANGVINDRGYGDDQLIGSVKYAGDDADTLNSFAATAGKFYHDYSATGFASGANIYFRIWDNAAPGAGSALFGESRELTSAYDDSIMPLPNNHALLNPAGGSTLTVQFTQATPEAPTTVSGVPHGAAAGGSPSVTVNTNTCLHGRWYDLEVSSPESSASGPFSWGHFTVVTSTNSKHVADINTGGSRSTTITLGQTDDKKYVMVRARAANDYGNGAWTEAGPYLIPETPDPNPPVAITDLQVTTEGSSVILSWSAPYDQDKYGNQTICAEYNVRVSSEAIVDLPVSPFTPGQTNPDNVSRWTAALSVEAYFTPAPAIPAPAAYGTKQSVTIAGAAGAATLLFAIKAKDTTGNWSYISNVAGIGGAGGGVGGWAASPEVTFDRGGNVALSWIGNAASYEIWSAGPDESLALLAGGITGKTYTDTSAGNERYYQVRPSGSQSGTRVVGKYTFNFTKASGKTGINTFSLPFGSGVSGRTVAAIDSADDIINDIGVDKVEFVGRWNDAEQKSEGRIVYTTDPSKWYGPDFPVQKGKSYQLSVSENVTWSIVGKK